MRNDDARTVRSETRRYATKVNIRHGLATLNSNNSVVYAEKHTVYVQWVL